MTEGGGLGELEGDTTDGASYRAGPDGEMGKLPFKAFRCQECGDVIGVYEPLVACLNSHTRTTSRAAEPGLKADGDYYHRMCFTQYSAPGAVAG